MPITLVSVVFALFLLVAAVTDFRDYRIPNWLVIALMALFALQVLRHLHEVSWVNQLGAGGICLAVGMLLFGLRQMGAGDAKLLAAVGFWSGLRALLPWLFLTSVAGLIVVAILVGTRLLLRRLHFDADRLPKPMRPGQGVPFAVAIAIGTLLSMQLFPEWLWQF